jgi:hypothetical protein
VAARGQALRPEEWLARDQFAPALCRVNKRHRAGPEWHVNAGTTQDKALHFGNCHKYGAGIARLPFMQVTHPRKQALLRFLLSVFLVLVVVFGATDVMRRGDFLEYGLTTVAVAEHGTPYILASDVERMIELTPKDEVGFRTVLGTIRDRIGAGEQVPIPGLLLSERGHYMSIHFVGYPTLAAIPFVILDRIGVNPWKAYQVVNYLPLLALAAACYLLLGSALRAWTGIVLFVLCGALPYLNWTSPEVFTMASLLRA